MNKKAFIIHQIINQPIPSNCFVLSDYEFGNDCIIVDPGSLNNDTLLDYIQKNNLRPSNIILTHEHFDHCMGVNGIVDMFNTPIICSELCSKNIKDEKLNNSLFYDGITPFSVKGDIICTEEFDDVLSFARKDIHFYYTPGHTDASICFTIKGFLFTGDTLIKDMKTVTKLRSGSKEKLQDSLAQFALLKGNGYIVYPGHGETFDLDDYDLNKAI